MLHPSIKKILLPVLLQAVCLFLISFTSYAGTGTNKQNTMLQDTVPVKSGQAEEPHKNTESANGLQQKDWDKMQADIQSALSKVDLQKIRQQVEEAIQKIDLQKVQLEAQKAISKIDMKKMQETLSQSLSQLKDTTQWKELNKEIQRALEEIKKINFDQQK